MSSSPAANFLNPPPVPDWLTTTLTAGMTSLKSSATAAEIKNTVLDPSTLMTLVRPQPDASRLHASTAPSASFVLNDQIRPIDCPSSRPESRSPSRLHGDSLSQLD